MFFPNRNGSKKRKARVQLHPDGVGFYQMDNGNVGSISSPFKSRGAAPLLTPGKMYSRFKAEEPPKSPVVDAPEAVAEAPKMIVRAPMVPLVRAPPPGPVVPAIELVAPFAVEAPEAPAVAAAEEVVPAEEVQILSKV
ncbi:hypothetical protein B9Z55_027347 [Caenorhabditis nigoni]|uniref:Uncharacterized protein n=1 Tax=Caenorhabditis nigoni TaxID=1611254 RepID=A0A2G5SFZ9_9PELO|nr:hypothetical protein B9Z55_027341 [Caenorhabditis nigoni]PIC14035.1 hypothetical protein B9Z55_027347 [Caenorhabditis nigoni]